MMKSTLLRLYKHLEYVLGSGRSPSSCSPSVYSPTYSYVDVNGSSGHSNPKPFLAFYPLEDMAFITSDEFKNISVQSENLPGSGVVYDSVDFDVSVMGFESKSKSKGNGNDKSCPVRPGGADTESRCGEIYPDLWPST
jgi:hypothetical protein